MHLGAAIEKESLLKRRKARVVVTCTTGIGSSKMLAMRLQKEFDTLEILEILSTVEMDEERLIKNGVDLIISTVRTSYKTIPSVMVSPILSTKEQEQVQDAIAMLTLEAEEPKAVGAILKPVDASLWTRDELVEWTRDLQGTAAIVEDLMQNFWTRAIPGESVDAVVEAYFKDRIPEEFQALVKQKLFEREALGSTIMEKEQILLLHNKVQGLKHLYVGVAVLDSGFWYKEKWIGAVVLLIGPKEMTRVQNEVISEVSRALIESGELIASIREKDPQKIEQVVGQIYYRHIFDRVTKLGKNERRKNEYF
jgi:mannitol operon transcriptional antiterminator